MSIVTVVKFRKDVIYPYLSRPDRDTIKYTPEIEKLGVVLHVFQDGVLAYKCLTGYEADEGMDFYRVVMSGQLNDLLQWLANTNIDERYTELLNAFVEIGNGIDFLTERLAFRIEE